MVTRKNEADRVKLSNLTMTHSHYDALPSVEDGESNSVRRLLLKRLLSTGIPLQVFSDLFSRLVESKMLQVQLIIGTRKINIG